MPPAVTLVTLAAAALELALCGYYWQSAFAAARPWLPYPLQQDELAARFAISRFIWKSAVPPAARRRYLIAHVFACLGLVSLTLLAFANGSAPGAAGLAAVSALALGQTLVDWRKSRALRQLSVSPPASAP